MRIGSTCSGAGALDLAVERVFGAQPAWFCEWEDAPSKVLEHHWPGVPNYRDLTAVDWATVPPVDVFTAGYPCQPFSAAGKRLGTDDERHLWPFIFVALNTLRPRWAVFENVAGHLTLGFDVVLGDLAAHGWFVRWFVCKASDVGAPHHRKRVFILVSREPQAVPDGAREIARLENVAPGRNPWVEPDAGLFGSIPFEGRWPRAGAVVDGVAYEVDADVAQAAALKVLPTPTVGNATGTNERRGGARSDEMLLPGVAVAAARGDLADDAILVENNLIATGGMLPTPQASDGNGGKTSAHVGGTRPSGAKRSIDLPTVAARELLPTPTASDADKARDNPAQAVRHSPPLSAVSAHFPTPRAAEAHQSMTAPAARQHVADGNGGLTEVLGAHLFPTMKTTDAHSSSSSPADADRNNPGLRAIGALLDVLPTPTASDCTGGGQHPDQREGHTAQLVDYALLHEDATRWGKYEPAIRRWEGVLGRPAPAPTEPNKNDRPRLAARFAEFLMGWLAGWVTDPAIGLTRPEQLKIIGNGVVDLQAEYAIRTVMSWPAAGEVAA
ncbi:DNA cytosine methyltransferase [Tsukamurella tyrosinosolvens]|uniref:DNA cytosine methyltransferase n=1 Tax=Tsukamurella tyrosinosolvens TaxID=57704 RepID=UPI001C69A33D|nr:DNA cytosine methyltransferase [Tsukamurella tyrosinosolvens]